ncbi:MAG: flippase [Chloroflexota bacterium]|nr:MAG: flippase [Chloroflexota bacterium]
MTVEQSVSAATQAAAPAPQAKTAAEADNHTRNALTAAKGGGIVASGRLFVYGTRFILAFLMARALGADQYGLYTLAISVATIVAGVAVLGLHTAMVRYVAILNKKGDEAGMWGAIQIGIGLPALISTVLAIGLFALSYVVAHNIYDRPELAPMLQLMAIIVPLMTLSTVLAGATHGFKKMHYAVIAQNFVQVIVRLILIAILFFLGMQAIHALAVFGVANLIAVGLLFYFLNKEFPLRRGLRSAKRNWRELMGYSLPVWISGLLRSFRSNIQVLLLGTFYTAAGVGVFNVVGRVNLVGRMAFNSISTSSRPIIAEIHSQKDRVELANIYQTTTRWGVTVNLPIFLTLLLFSEGILAIFGDDFIAGAMAMRVLAFAELVDAFTGTCGAIIDMTGLTRVKVANSVIQLILAITVNVLLIPKYGLMGAAVGALIVNAAINTLRMIEVWYVFRILPLNRTFIKPIAAALLALAVALLVQQLLVDNMNLLLLILQVAILFAVYAGLLLLLGLPEQEKVIVAQARRRIAKRRLRSAKA